MAIPPFPTTGLLDDFDRADGAVGANWTLAQGTHSLLVETNQVKKDALDTTGTAMLWNGAAGDDQEAWATVTTVPSGLLDGFWFLVRMTGSGATRDGYQAGWSGTSAGYQIQRVDNGAGTTLHTNVATTPVPAAGDMFGIEVLGNDPPRIVLYHWPVAEGAWRELFSATDSADTFPGGGSVGLLITRGTLTRMDDFSGGTSGKPPQVVADIAWPDSSSGTGVATGAGE